MSKPFLTAEWRKLVLANYSIDPRILQPWLPSAVELDSFNGITYVSLVGFMFRETAVMGLKIPLGKTCGKSLCSNPVNSLNLGRPFHPHPSSSNIQIA